MADPALAQGSATISKPIRRTQADFIEAVVRSAVIGGTKDLSMQELKSLLARHHDTAMDMSSISRIVNGLVEDKRLVRDADHKRACTVSGVLISPIAVPLVQGRIFQ